MDSKNKPCPPTPRRSNLIVRARHAGGAAAAGLHRKVQARQLADRSHIPPNEAEIVAAARALVVSFEDQRRLCSNSEQSETGEFLESGEVFIACDQRHIMIEAALGDESVRDLRPILMLDQQGSGPPRAFPVP